MNNLPTTPSAPATIQDMLTAFQLKNRNLVNQLDTRTSLVGTTASPNPSSNLSMQKMLAMFQRDDNLEKQQKLLAMFARSDQEMGQIPNIKGPKGPKDQIVQMGQLGQPNATVKPLAIPNDLDDSKIPVDVFTSPASNVSSSSSPSPTTIEYASTPLSKSLNALLVQTARGPNAGIAAASAVPVAPVASVIDVKQSLVSAPTTQQQLKMFSGSGGGAEKNTCFQYQLPMDRGQYGQRNLNELILFDQKCIYCHVKLPSRYILEKHVQDLHVGTLYQALDTQMSPTLKGGGRVLIKLVPLSSQRGQKNASCTSGVSRVYFDRDVYQHMVFSQLVNNVFSGIWPKVLSYGIVGATTRPAWAPPTASVPVQIGYIVLKYVEISKLANFD